MIRTYSFDGTYKRLSILIEKPPLRLINPDNLKRNVGEDNWDYIKKVIKAEDHEEMRRISKFFYDGALKAGRERRYLYIRTKPVPSRKFLTPSMIASRLDWWWTKFLDKTEMGDTRKSMLDAKNGSILEQFKYTTEEEVEEEIIRVVEEKTKANPWINPYDRNRFRSYFGRDQMNDYIVYHLTLACFGSLYY